MKKKGELFRKAFIISAMILLLAIVILLGAYTYFGRITFINLEQKALNRTADAAQTLFGDQNSDSVGFNQYLNSISKASDISYILIFP